MKWFLMRFLHGVRRALVKDPSPTRIRRDMARFERMLAGKGDFSLSPPVDLGSCTGAWLQGGQVDEGRVILYLHGGAFVAESPNAHCAMLARVCRRAGARGFYLTYRLAPEHPYPAAPDDCLAAYRFLLDQGIEASSIVIAGDSAGGNLTVVTAMRIRDLGLPPPAALVLLSPVLDASFSGHSIRRNDGLDPLFRSSIVKKLVPYYVRDDQLGHPYVSPLGSDVRGLPPALAIVGSSEILLDDSVRFASRADQVDLMVWHGMPHVFPVMHGLDEATAAVDAIADFIRRRTPVRAAANTAPSVPANC